MRLNVFRGRDGIIRHAGSGKAVNNARKKRRVYRGTRAVKRFIRRQYR